MGQVRHSVVADGLPFGADVGPTKSRAALGPPTNGYSQETQAEVGTGVSVALAAGATPRTTRIPTTRLMVARLADIDGLSDRTGAGKSSGSIGGAQTKLDVSFGTVSTSGQGADDTDGPQDATGGPGQAPGVAAGSLRAELARIDAASARARGIAEAMEREGLSRVFGREAVRRELARLIDAATESVDSLLPHVPSERALTASLVDDAPLLERGVRVRSIFPRAAAEIAYVPTYARSFRAMGASLRVSSIAPVRALVFDQETSVVIVKPRTAESYLVVARDHGIADAISALFLVLWDRAADVFDDSDRGALSAAERSILQGLMIGQKDDAIARTLGVAAKTVRRHIAALCVRAGAESRVALGARAVQLGWIEGCGGHLGPGTAHLSH